MERMKKITQAGIAGVIVNILLGVIKIIIGLLSNSVAIVSDAVNNFSDSLSSVISIVATKLATKGATKKHPFGYGRIEYFSGAIISIIVIVTGVEFLQTSIEKIINPTESTYSVLSLFIILVAIGAKILLGIYSKRVGRKYNSPALMASGKDALSDAVITIVTLAGAIITTIGGINLDGWLGAFVSLFVIKAGIEMLWNILSKLLGERPEVELVRSIIQDIQKHKGILGAYDLVLNNYGPNQYLGMVNVEMEDTTIIKDAYSVIRSIQIEVYKKYNLTLYVGFYAINTDNEKVRAAEKRVKEILMEHAYILQVHAFAIHKENNFMSFDAVVDFDCKDIKGLEREIREQLQREFEEYTIFMNLEKDFSVS